jgi:hypothetical protein
MLRSGCAETDDGGLTPVPVGTISFRCVHGRILLLRSVKGRSRMFFVQDLEVLSDCDSVPA